MAGQNSTIVREATPIAAVQQTPRILVVEDDDELRRIVCTVLRRLGYTITEASNGAEALQYLDDGLTYDLLFTDVVLPGGMNGLDIAMAAQDRYPGIKILFTSGYAADALLNGRPENMQADLLSKPYRRGHLTEKIGEILPLTGTDG